MNAAPEASTGQSNVKEPKPGVMVGIAIGQAWRSIVQLKPSVV